MLVVRAEPSSPAPAQDAAPVSDAIRSRERGLSLLSRANRWLIGLAVLLAAALTGLTAHAFHTSSASAQTATTAPAQGAAENSGGGASAPQLQSPASPPAVAAPEPVAPVVSGGS